MAKDEPTRTDDLELGPGLVVTPGHELPPPPRPRGIVASDRRIAADGTPDPVPTLSTHPHAKQGLEGDAARAMVAAHAPAQRQGEQAAEQRAAASREAKSGTAKE